MTTPSSSVSNTGEPIAPELERAEIVENVPIARDTYRIRLRVERLAERILPGQFVMVRPVWDRTTDPLLGRPFALYDIHRDSAGRAVAVDLVYLVVGRGTAVLAERKSGECVSVWGPLGGSFGPPPNGPVFLVAGGIGQTPFLALARWWLQIEHYGIVDLPWKRSPVPAITLLYGARSASYLACVEDFRAQGVEVAIATNDGTAGYHGYVTELLERRLESGWRPERLVGCGPHPMLATLARIANRVHLPCQVSLENHMACGFGACFSCVVSMRQADGSADLRRVCIEGPIFDSRKVIFEE